MQRLHLLMQCGKNKKVNFVQSTRRLAQPRPCLEVQRVLAGTEDPLQLGQTNVLAQFDILRHILPNLCHAFANRRHKVEELLIVGDGLIGDSGNQCVVPNACLPDVLPSRCSHGHP